MKKLLILFFVLALSSNAFATQRNYGCGLGSLVFGDGADTKLLQLVATFLNGICSNQTTGITFDIDAFKCTATPSWASNDVFEFVQGNMDTLIRDVAAGSGDSINTLAALMQVEDVASYGEKLQQNFALIFPDADVQSAHVADTVFMLSSL